MKHDDLQPLHITSRDNALYKSLKRLAQSNVAYRRQKRLWLEGEHLCDAVLRRGLLPAIAVFAQSHWPPAFSRLCGGVELGAAKVVVLPDALMAALGTLESPAPVAFVLDKPEAQPIKPHAPTVVLDRLQDAGNVGSILRSAAAFGFAQVVALRGTAALWSTKVLRAGMGSHFALQLIEAAEPQDLQSLAVPLLVTDSHRGDFLHACRLPWPCAWVMGNEGQGVSPALVQCAARSVRIMQPGGEESLNVAAAAAVCMHASAVQRDL